MLWQNIIVGLSDISINAPLKGRDRNPHTVPKVVVCLNEVHDSTLVWACEARIRENFSNFRERGI